MKYSYSKDINVSFDKAEKNVVNALMDVGFGVLTEVNIQGAFKSKLNIDFKHDPELIAGLIIQVGSLMVDTSIKTKLKKLEKNMLEA